MLELGDDKVKDMFFRLTRRLGQLSTDRSLDIHMMGGRVYRARIFSEGCSPFLDKVLEVKLTFFSELNYASFRLPSALHLPLCWIVNCIPRSQPALSRWHLEGYVLMSDPQTSSTETPAHDGQ